MPAGTIIPWLYCYLKEIIPQVEKELTGWRHIAGLVQDAELRRQALSSLKHKAFHCYGGSVLALLAPRSSRSDIVSLITAYQTISDYLDNLCDRGSIYDPLAFYRLHDSMLAAVDLRREAFDDFYQHYAGCREEGYLFRLVEHCRGIVASLPRLNPVQERIVELTTYYINLQSIKHISPAERRPRLEAYLQDQVPNPHRLKWWELAAATGSTLGVFALWALAARPDCTPESAEAVYESYFPWIGGLHILLDYLIDQQEDEHGGDLNFVAFYSTAQEAWEALEGLSRISLARVQNLPEPALHRLVISGLLAMYLSDAKVRELGYLDEARHLLKTSGRGNLALRRLCGAVRTLKGM